MSVPPSPPASSVAGCPPKLACHRRTGFGGSILRRWRPVEGLKILSLSKGRRSKRAVLYSGLTPYTLYLTPFSYYTLYLSFIYITFLLFK
jgi:hypothetical protein